MNFQNDSHHRFVKYTRDARGDIKLLSNSHKGFREVLQAVHWHLGNYAHQGKQIKESQPLYLYQSKKRTYAPSFDFFYCYDEREVRVHNILLTEEDESSN